MQVKTRPIQAPDPPIRLENPNFCAILVRIIANKIEKFQSNSNQINSGGCMEASRMKQRVAAICGLLFVALGAFGAHGLEPVLAQHGTQDIWRTAVFYHALHGLVLWFIASDSRLGLAWWSFLTGILVFSGSLYLLAVTGLRWWGAVTPIGGIAFLLGWGWMAFQTGMPVRQIPSREYPPNATTSRDTPKKE